MSSPKDFKFNNLKNKNLARLLREFDNAAQIQGFVSDQGSNKEAEKGLAEYIKAAQKLENYLIKEHRRLISCLNQAI